MLECMAPSSLPCTLGEDLFWGLGQSLEYCDLHVLVRVQLTRTFMAQASRLARLFAYLKPEHMLIIVKVAAPELNKARKGRNWPYGLAQYIAKAIHPHGSR